ncbi:hypothetical protein NP233_g8501 [Leucocoprinus birnbaumii]|uniref:Nephrocystin 3-like N-terminal domain-containing protein n=1 Tax=Leucocoprinus birnbaumii TaxID=56174 RepID=A0AAD5VM81_9AGAR|nr:hypothetical protein NP233_g8501 [Leucocoprinus birnbaumii]
MKGPAGVGKSSIAQTSAMKVKMARYLGAAFFFSVNGRRNDHTRFFPSLAYQLSTIRILLDYRNMVNDQVLIDSTIFNKPMRAQFEFLIADPLRELKELGKEVPRMSIFIDGLDECKDKDAQSEIIEIIAESVQDQSTPFHWAFFSREEPRITSTFALPHISPHCHVIYLPISRDTDKEIEAYLRGALESILCRRLGNMTLSSPWPTDDDVQKLVHAAAGLFAYAATIVRFIDSHSYSRFREMLQAILSAIVYPHCNSLPVFTNLDSLYTLILQGVPADIASSTNLLLLRLAGGNPSSPFSVLEICNPLSISEAEFKSICCYLHAVLVYHVPLPETSETFAPNLRSYLEQDLSFESNTALIHQFHQSHGTVSFLHKSFYDFLRDPNRSGSVFNRDTVVTQLLLHHYHQYLRFAPLYVVRGSKLGLASDASTSDPSSLLSWPSGSKFFDSFLALYTFRLCSTFFTGQAATLPYCLHRIMGRLPVEARGEIDFRKALVAQGMARQQEWEYLSLNGVNFQFGEGVIFSSCGQDIYNQYGISLLQMVLDAETLHIVKPFRPYHSPSVSMSVQSSSSLSRLDRRHGLHTVGFGEKSVTWYWEYDEENHRYYEFQTLDYAKAMRIFQLEKYKMWNESWVPPPELLEDDPVDTINHLIFLFLALSLNSHVNILPASPSPSVSAVVMNHFQRSEVRDGCSVTISPGVAASTTTCNNNLSANVHTALIQRPGTPDASAQVDADCRGNPGFSDVYIAMLANVPREFCWTRILNDSAGLDGPDPGPIMLSLDPLSNLTSIRVKLVNWASLDFIREISSLLRRCPDVRDLYFGSYKTSISFNRILGGLAVDPRHPLKLKLYNVELTSEDIEANIRYFKHLSTLKFSWSTLSDEGEDEEP